MDGSVLTGISDYCDGMPNEIVFWEWEGFAAALCCISRRQPVRCFSKS